MTSADDSLEDIRREIDMIDDRMHDLLMQRAALVERLTTVKGRDRQSSVRPAREAAVLRRIARRHAGPFPRGSVLRIWREMMVSLTRMQDPRFCVAVFADAEEPGYWDLARDMFGSMTPMSVHANPRDVLGQVGEGTATFGVLPCPTELRPDPWWKLLCTPGSPRVVFRLPFAERGNARPGERGAPEAFALARFQPEETGSDRSLLVVETRETLSRAALGDLVRRAQLSPVQLISHAEETVMHLAVVDGFVASDDPRLTALSERELVERVVSIGSYPEPLRDSARGRGRAGLRADRAAS